MIRQSLTVTSHPGVRFSARRITVSRGGGGGHCCCRRATRHRLSVPDCKVGDACLHAAVVRILCIPRRRECEQVFQSSGQDGGCRHRVANETPPCKNKAADQEERSAGREVEAIGTKEVTINCEHKKQSKQVKPIRETSTPASTAAAGEE